MCHVSAIDVMGSQLDSGTFVPTQSLPLSMCVTGLLPTFL